jgi:hypothetical protein
MNMIGIVGWMVVGATAGGLAGVTIRDGETWERAFLLAIGVTIAGGVVTSSGVGAILGLVMALTIAKRVSWRRAILPSVWLDHTNRFGTCGTRDSRRDAA